MPMIKTPNEGHDEDENCDNYQSGFQLLSYEAHTRRMKKCAIAEDAVYALTSLRGQGQVKIFHSSVLANTMPTLPRWNPLQSVEW